MWTKWTSIWHVGSSAALLVGAWFAGRAAGPMVLTGEPGRLSFVPLIIVVIIAVAIIRRSREATP